MQINITKATEINKSNYPQCALTCVNSKKTKKGEKSVQSSNRFLLVFASYYIGQYFIGICRNPLEHEERPYFVEITVICKINNFSSAMIKMLR